MMIIVMRALRFWLIKNRRGIMKKIIILSILLSILNVQCVKADNIAEHTFVVKTTNKSCSQRSVTKK